MYLGGHPSVRLGELELLPWLLASVSMVLQREGY